MLRGNNLESLKMENSIDPRDPLNMTGRKRKLLVGIAGVLFAATFILASFVDLPIDKETFYYTFSTIAQSILTLVAFLGAIVIFRLQLYENKRRELADEINSNVLSARGFRQVPLLLPDGVFSEAKKYLPILSAADQETLNNIFKEVTIIDDSSDVIKLKMVDFTLIAICSAVISILGLFLTPFLNGLVLHLSQSGSNYTAPLGKIFLFFTTLFACMGLFYALGVILEIFKSISRKW